MSSTSQSPPPAARLRGATSSPVRDILALTERPGVVSFAGGLPAPELFDVGGLRAAFASVLSEHSGARALQYSTTEGNPLLRRLVAERLTRRGLDTTADDLLITSGSQQALTLVAAVLLEPGGRVLVEEPSYLAALQCFGLAGAEAVPVACDEDGLLPDAVEAMVAQHRPTLLYTVPTFHNPTGRTLPIERRRALAGVVERTGLWLVEDDPYGELRYRGAALPAVASLPAARTLDVACGTGFLTRHLHGELTCFDQSATMLEVARAQVPDATAFVRGDALELPFGDGAFDRLFTGHFYGHLEPGDRERFVAEARRVARELVVVDSAPQGGEPRAEWQERLLTDGSTWQVYKRYFSADG
ncbi:MAG: aminotransferase class I/II-fold pyridoxal phosphate-dependent enzyme, partial [Solirubrobacteraceae bacterium]